MDINMTERRCADCIYWDEEGDIHAATGPLCRKNPPSLVTFKTENAMGTQEVVRAEFPEVGAEDWCFEFKDLNMHARDEDRKAAELDFMEGVAMALSKIVVKVDEKGREKR
jgi:hypothetical protein